MCAVPSCESPKYEDGRQPYDPDLNGWRSASWSPFVMGDRITGFAYGIINSQDRYVAISGTGVIAWSRDGDIWKKAQLPQELSGCAFNAVCFGKTGSSGRFVAAGDDGIYTWSDDGENWFVNDPVEMPGFGAVLGINGITFGAGFFVAVGENRMISCSTDGINWTTVSSGGGITLNDIAYDGGTGRFYVVGSGGNRAWTDNPSGAWTFLGADTTGEPPMGDANILKVAVGRYGGGIGIGVLFTERHVDGSPVNRFAVSITPDFSFGYNLDKNIEQFLFRDFTMNGIAWGGGNFVAAGSCAMIGFWPSAQPSRTGERFFRAISFPEFRKWEISALEACNGRFFVGNVDGKIGYSK